MLLRNKYIKEKGKFDASCCHIEDIKPGLQTDDKVSIFVTVSLPHNLAKIWKVPFCRFQEPMIKCEYIYDVKKVRAFLNELCPLLEYDDKKYVGDPRNKKVTELLDTKWADPTEIKYWILTYQRSGKNIIPKEDIPVNENSREYKEMRECNIGWGEDYHHFRVNEMCMAFIKPILDFYEGEGAYDFSKDEHYHFPDHEIPQRVINNLIFFVNFASVPEHYYLDPEHFLYKEDIGNAQKKGYKYPDVYKRYIEKYHSLLDDFQEKKQEWVNDYHNHNRFG